MSKVSIHLFQQVHLFEEENGGTASDKAPSFFRMTTRDQDMWASLINGVRRPRKVTKARKI